MKSLCTMIALGLLASTASAADVQISRSALASIGLPGFVKMSQADALSVRGKSYTITVSGSSVANGPFGSGSASNAYYGSASGGHGSHGITGGSQSYVVAGPTAVISTGTFGFGLGAIAGGSAGVSVH